jgi:dimethylargininase
MIVFTREVSPSIVQCELTHLTRTPIDLVRARAQHRAYEAALTTLGCTVRRLPDTPDSPDAVFVQDAAFVFDEVAVIARPGAASRRAETATVVPALEALRTLQFIEAPGTLDGGDMVCLGRSVFIGQTARTNAHGASQVEDILKPFGYTVQPVALTGCLHLQTAITPVADRMILVNRAWVDPTVFGDVEVIDVDPSEPFAANALRIGNVLILPDAVPKTRARLEARGLGVVQVDVSELAKAEAGVTCCCLPVPAAVPDRAGS